MESIYYDSVTKEEKVIYLYLSFLTRKVITYDYFYLAYEESTRSFRRTINSIRCALERVQPNTLILYNRKYKGYSLVMLDSTR